MVALTSSMLPLGSSLPSLELVNSNPRFTEKRISINTGSDKGIEFKGYLIAVISNHCPFVINLASALGKVGNFAQESGMQVIAIGCNDIVNYPADAPEHIPVFSEQYRFDFAYCFDESQESAKKLQAECTPDFYLFDAEGKLFYRGQLDESRPSNGVKATGSDLQGAVEVLLKGENAPVQQKPSLGCSIKWKP